MIPLKLRIGIDIDGCVYEWDVAVRDALVSRFGIERPGVSTHWSYLKDVLPRECWDWIWTSDAAEMIFGRLDTVYPRAVEVVNGLANEHEVHFVTHRNPHRNGAATARFLAHHFRNYRGVHVLDNSCPKWELGSWDVFIDDKPETVDGFLVSTDAQVLMPHRPWNILETDVTVQYTSPRFEVFTDWDEVPGMIAAGFAAIKAVELP